MSTIKRMTGPRGPRFYDEGDKAMFVLVLDGNTRFGPFPATDEHMEQHPAAWRQYLADKAQEQRGEVPNDFPGQPLIRAEDPPGGPPAPRPAKQRGRSAEAVG